MALIVLRLVAIFGVLALIYIALSAYLRWDRAQTLAHEHDTGAGNGLTRDDYVAKGLAEYERSWSKKALLGIFALPVVLVIVLGLIANYG